MPELSEGTRVVLYYLLRAAMREDGKLERTFHSLFDDGTDGDLAIVQKEVASFSEWCSHGMVSENSEEAAR
jgi:hypothetical protein